MSMTLVTPPNGEALFLGEVKDFCRVEGTRDDAILHSLIRSTRSQIEGPNSVYGLALLTQTWDLKADDFVEGYCWRYDGPGNLSGRSAYKYRGPGDKLMIPLPPLQAVVFVKYLTPEGVLTTISAADYQVAGVGGSRPGYVQPAYSKSWPSTRSVPEAVTIRFTAGYGDANAVPDAIREAMLRIISHRYENRGLGLTAASWQELPDVQELLWPFRVFNP